MANHHVIRTCSGRTLVDWLWPMFCIAGLLSMLALTTAWDEAARASDEAAEADRAAAYRSGWNEGRRELLAQWERTSPPRAPDCTAVVPGASPEKQR